MATTADDQPSEFPLQIPARMLNEYSYCPRLFHLEWMAAWLDTDVWRLF